MGSTMNNSVFKKCSGNKARTCGIASKKHEEYAQRLRKTTILNGDFKSIIKKYDTKDTVFYLDPPYAVPTKDHYRFGTLTPEEVKKTVDGIKGKFVLSYNDSPQIRKMFCGRGTNKYRCKTIKTNYKINKLDNNNRPTNELLIKNF